MSVYVDDGSAADDGELTVDIDGHFYHAPENYDNNHDGIADSVLLDAADGGRLIYSDTDHDGQADEVVELDADGQVARQAEFDATDGRWIPDPGPGTARPGAHAGGAPPSTGGESITVDTPSGGFDAGAATVDSDHDGHADTAVVHDSAGDTTLFTDADGDGSADSATEITADGEVTVSAHNAEHAWTEIERGHIDSTGHYQRESTGAGPWRDAEPARVDDSTWVAHRPSPWADGTRADIARIDSTTGQWISAN